MKIGDFFIKSLAKAAKNLVDGKIENENLAFSTS